MSEKFGNFVDEFEDLEHFRENLECVCGKDLSEQIEMGGRFSDFSYRWCENCDRKYMKLEERYTTPKYILSAEGKEGAHRCDLENPPPLLALAIYALMDMLPNLEEHMDLHPSNYDGIWYYKEDGVVLGYLIEQDSAIDNIGVAKGFRRQGIGSKLVEKFMGDKSLEKLEITGSFDEAKDFWRNLTCDVKIIADHDEL